MPWPRAAVSRCDRSGDGPVHAVPDGRPLPPGHPERLVPQQEPSPAEQEIWNELSSVLVWPR